MSKIARTVGIPISTTMNAGTIVQVHLFAAQPQGSVLAVIQLTGSCAGARAGTEVDLIRSIMKTLRINP